MNRFAKLGAPLVAACALLTGWPALAIASSLPYLTVKQCLMNAASPSLVVGSGSWP